MLPCHDDDSFPLLVSYGVRGYSEEMAEIFGKGVADGFPGYVLGLDLVLNERVEVVLQHGKSVGERMCDKVLLIWVEVQYKGKLVVVGLARIFLLV